MVVILGPVGGRKVLVDGEPPQNTEAGVREAVLFPLAVRVRTGLQGRPGRRHGRGIALPNLESREGYRRRGGEPGRVGAQGKPGDRRER
ncbi:hypothetical protein IscW_ISCW005271 [Ixodes scapularis]|uniref:Uncharacterized protein n=1 Tax=Ixodes scapularis TaxID=6945 RepID=B7PLR6_IXOSC|nr:hypothetical protein IscW_ISCW005271 [Ixodes scapularis]|eukprot:XP_002434714.1 hypothetical protein IscW_ISCW005271 [Ixodes scapularis]